MGRGARQGIVHSVAKSWAVTEHMYLGDKDFLFYYILWIFPSLPAVILSNCLG